MSNSRHLMPGYCLAALAVLFQCAASGEDRPRSPIQAAPAPIPIEKLAASIDDAEQFTLQMLVVEFRGEFKAALREAGFQEQASGTRFVLANQPTEGSDSERLSKLLRAASEKTEVSILSRPQVRSLLGQPATVQIGTQQRLVYMEQTAKKAFTVKEFELPTNLGLEISLTGRATASPTQVELSPFKFTLTTLDGREPIPGINLDIGRPIITTRKLETTLVLTRGGETVGLELPGPPDRHPMIFVSLRPLLDVTGPRTEPLPQPAPTAD